MIRRGVTAGLAWAWLIATPAAAADLVGVDDLILLARGGVAGRVIIQHVERWGLRAELTAGDLVALRAAGASDDLLAHLAGMLAEGSGEARTLSLPGGGGLLLTNLDEDGRRIGGEAPVSAATNQIQAAAHGGVSCRESVASGWEGGTAHVSCGRALTEGEWGERELAPESLPQERWSDRAERPGPRLGTPGGYSRYKLYYSREPESGFRTWVLPVSVLVRTPGPWGGVWAGTFTPPVIVY